MVTGGGGWLLVKHHNGGAEKKNLFDLAPVALCLNAIKKDFKGMRGGGVNKMYNIYPCFFHGEKIRLID